MNRLARAIRSGRATTVVEPLAHYPVRDVYIIGTPFSGSTLLGQFLNGHPAVFHTGELSRLGGFDVGPPLDPVCQSCHMNDRNCEIWTDEFQESVVAAGPSEAVNAVRSAVDFPIVVEGSKYPDWLKLVIDDGIALDRTAMLLSVRSPFGFASSMLHHDDVDVDDIEYMARAWRDTITAALELAAITPIPLLTVRYEAFALSPELVGPAICGFLGIDYTPAMLEFWNSPTHAIGGNGGAYAWYDVSRGIENSVSEHAVDRIVGYKQRNFGGWFDDAWKRELSPDQVEQIVSVPAITEVAQSVGYRLDEMVGAYRFERARAEQDEAEQDEAELA